MAKSKKLTAAMVKAAAQDLKYDNYDIFGNNPFWAGTKGIFRMLGFTPEISDYIAKAKEAGFIVDADNKIYVK